MISLVRERAELLHAGRDRVRLAARPLPRQHGAEHPRYEAERATVEELRRLSALRADFVALVSHELRSPMAAVIGSAKTLQRRWRELTPEQRESFLALIDHETNRLADLVADVLDTSQDRVGAVQLSVHGRRRRRARPGVGGRRRERSGRDRDPLAGPRPLPLVRGDRDRLRQVLTNLLDNAVKYSPAGEAVEVEALAENGRISVEVRDSGPGVAPEHHALIFEKFGRVTGEHREAGNGPRPLHRAVDRAGPRRLARGALEGRPRHDLRAPASGRPRLIRPSRRRG